MGLHFNKKGANFKSRIKNMNYLKNTCEGVYLVYEVVSSNAANFRRIELFHRYI